MPTTMLTPVDRGNARPSGATLWRKQLLPVGEIDYKGRKIAFTREYLAGLVRAFTTRAYDQVPFQLADHANTHTNDPERFRGEVRGLELTPDGLDVIVSATEDGADVLRKNPALGVSARIVEDYQRADGKFFPAAIQHVLGTLDPRIPGMRPWQAVEAANDDDGEIIDLTALEYAQDAPEPVTDPSPAEDGDLPTEEEHMAFTPEQEARLAKLLDLPDTQFEALLAEKPETDENDEPQLTDAELEALLAEVETGTTDEESAEEQDEPVLAGASLSAEAQDAIDLANAQAEQASQEVATMRRQLDAAAYAAERDTFARKGVPVRFIEMARPLLEGSGRTVDLANGKTADAGAIVREMLTGFAGTMRELGLDVELGTPLDGGDDTAAKEAEAAEERHALVAAYRKTTGI